MLEELVIHDFALIDRVHVRFEPGFNVLTGETGAGKSILIGAIGFLLGGKADTGSIRAGADETVVSGVLSVRGNDEALSWLSERGIPPEEGQVILRRSMRANGRGSIHVNSCPVTRQDLAAFTALLVDIHGQHDQGALLEPETHRILLDRYAGIEDEVRAYSERFQDLSAKRRTFEKMAVSDREREREIQLLEFAIEEIGQAKLKPGESSELESEEKRLSQHERLSGGLETAHASLHDASGVLHGLRKARSALESAEAIDSSLSALTHRLEDAYYEIEDVTETLRHYADSTQFSPERLEAVEERLSLIRKLEKKYGDGIPEILAYASKCAADLESLKNWEDDRAALSESILAMEKDVYSRALAISAKRTAAATAIDGEISNILKTLGMPKARFETALRKKDSDNGKAVVGQWGIDVVEFMIAPNPGEGMKPLSKVASGGELSRIMLAIKTILASGDTVGTMIFDEIDTGIGGEVALAVAGHMARLAGKKQVFCITHLAVIASRADNHIVVTKRQEGTRTLTSLERVESGTRIAEIARMLSGDSSGEASRRHAEELLGRSGSPESQK